MNRMGPLARPLLLALVGAAGIVGMLLSESWGDALCFVLAALPLAVGGWYAWTMRGSGRAPARGKAARDAA